MAQFTDIVFPSGNEAEFINMAKKLGIGGIIFCYPFEIFHTVQKDIKDDKVKINYAASTNNFKSIASAENKKTTVISNSNDRQVFEYKFEKTSPLILFELESIANYDSLHSRHSGLNHILCSLMNKNNIVLGVSFWQLLNSISAKRAQIIGRVTQNIRFARKFKVSLKLASFSKLPCEMRSYHDMLSLGIVLGMHPSEAKKALEGTIK